jgi:hypothetical protein
MMPGEEGRPTKVLVAPEEYLKSIRTAAGGSGIRFRAHPDPESLDGLIHLMSSALGRMSDATAVSAEELQSAPVDPAAAWEVAAVQLDIRIGIGGEPVRPWVLLVVSADALILSTEMQTEAPSADRLAEVVRRAITRPAIGEPCRPAVLYVRTADDACDLAARLGDLGIRIEVAERFEHLDDVLEGLSCHLAGEPMKPLLIESPGLSQSLLAAYYEAACRYYDARPWKHFRSDEAFRIESSLAEDSPWHATVMGQSGVTLGLAVCRKLEALRRLMEGQMGVDDHKEAAQQLDGMSVQFGEEFDLAPRDSDAIVQFGWPVAAPEAYPLLLSVRPGAELVAPTPEELRIVTECLNGIATLSQSSPTPPAQHTGAAATITYLGPVDDL